jgi:hypothetical protein
MPKYCPALLTLATVLIACGAEVAGTAAAVGALQATQAQQAQAQQQQAGNRLTESLKAVAAGASAAARE